MVKQLLIFVGSWDIPSEFVGNIEVNKKVEFKLGPFVVKQVTVYRAQTKGASQDLKGEKLV